MSSSLVESPQDLQDALKRCHVTCQAAHDAMIHSDPGTSSSAETTPVTVIRTDFLSLLALLYSHSTRLALSFKPPTTTSASIKCLNDISDDVARLANCASTVKPSDYGATISKEFNWATQEVIESLRALSEASPDNGPPSEDKLYLRRIGEVHATIEKVKGNLSKDNYEAVEKRWKQNTEALDDAVSECKGMTEEEDGAEIGDEEDDGEGGWKDLLGEDGTGQQMTQEERQRALKIHPLIRLTVLLHKKVLSHHLLKLKPRVTVTSGHQRFDKMLISSNNLVAATDDLVASLYSPQDITALQSKVGILSDIIEQFKADTGSYQLERVMGGPLATESNVADPNVEKDRRWFELCFTQLKKVILEFEP